MRPWANFSIAQTDKGPIVLQRLHRLAVHALVALLITMSMAQAVTASPALPLQPSQSPMSVHDTHDGSHHDHTQAMRDEQSKRDCLKFCLENVPDHYLASAWAETPAPELIALAPAQPASLVFAIKNHRTNATGSARGPPGCRVHNSVGGLRGLLLLNARLRI